MTTEQKAEYKKLGRQIDEANGKYLKTPIAKRNPTNFNNRLGRMQTFLKGLEEDYSNNRFMKIKPYPVTN